MLHILIDSCIYRADRKRNKPAFRALTRLARAGVLQLHIPEYVKGEVLSQQQRDVRDQISKMKAAAEALLRTTGAANMSVKAEEVVKLATDMGTQAEDSVKAELQSWIAEVKASEHPVRGDHGARVASAYFAGSAPFRAAKQRDDLPDAFIWETALDLVEEHGTLIVISKDGRLREAAEEHDSVEMYETLDDFIESDECQDALEELTPQIVTGNVERIKKLLPAIPHDHLMQRLGNDIIHELAGKTVRHDAILDDNHEATIIMVGAPENVEFNFTELDHYSDADVGIPFSANVDCELNYAIYKGDYYSLDDTEGIFISERNRHYYDADQEYTISIQGYLTVMIDPTDLEKDNMSNEELQELIRTADTSTEITEREVCVPGW